MAYRWQINAQIIHYDIATKHEIDMDDVSIEKILLDDVIEKHKDVIEEQHEQAFMNVVIAEYEQDFLPSNQSIYERCYC